MLHLRIWSNDEVYASLHSSVILDDEIKWRNTHLTCYSADFQQDSATTHDVQYAMHPLKNAWLRLIIHDLWPPHPLYYFFSWEYQTNSHMKEFAENI